MFNRLRRGLHSYLIIFSELHHFPKDLLQLPQIRQVFLGFPNGFFEDDLKHDSQDETFVKRSQTFDPLVQHPCEIGARRKLGAARGRLAAAAGGVQVRAERIQKSQRRCVAALACQEAK